MKKTQRWYLIWGALAIGVLPLRAEIKGSSFNPGQILSSVLTSSRSEEAQNLKVVQQQRKIIGTVKDEKGVGVPSANIKIKGTNYNIVSDLDGNFSVNVDENATLIFTYVGFNSQEVIVGSKSKLDVILK